MDPDLALQAIENVLSQSVLPVPFGQAKAMLDIVAAGLKEREGFRDRIAVLEKEIKVSPARPINNGNTKCSTPKR